MSKERILIVEDEMIIALGIQKTLERLGYCVSGIAATGEDAVSMALELAPDLILMDIILSGEMDGIEAARRIRKRADRPIIYLTANADGPTVERARDTQPYGYLNKPVNERDLMSNIDTALNKHRMELRLRESEEKYRNLVESLNDIIISSDENGIVTYISPQIKEISGFDQSEVAGSNFAVHIHPDDLRIAIDMFEGARKGEKREGTCRGFSKTGEELWLRISGKPVFVESRFNGVRGIISDITARKRAEEAVRQKNDELTAANEELQAIIEELESTNEEFEIQNRELVRAQEELAEHEARLAGLLRVAPVGLGIVSGNDMLAWTNSMFQDMTGYAGEELEGRSPAMLFSKEDDAWLLQKKLRLEIEQAGAGSAETRIMRKGGTIIDVLAGVTFMDGKGPGAGIIVALLDITERKKAAEALRVSEEKYRHLVENITDTLWLLDLKTLKYVYNTPSSVNLVGYTPEELSRMTIAEIIKPEYLEVVRKIIAEELEQDGRPGVDPNRIRRFEIEQTHKNGSTVWTEVTAKILRDGVGRPYRALGVSHDITERKKTAEALRQSEETYRLLANNIIDYLWVIDIVTLKFNYASPSVRLLLGYNEKEALGLTIYQVLTPESLEKARSILAAERARDREPGIDPERSVTVDLEHVRRDGSIVWAEVKTKFLRNEKGGISAVLGVSRDITARKRAEQALAESEKKYRLLADNVSDSIWVLDMATMKFSYNSPSSVNILGYSEEESLDLNPEKVVTKESLERAMTMLGEELARDGRPGVDPDRTIKLELEQIHKDGHIVWTEVNTRPLRNESGAVTGVLGVSRDISARRKAEQALAESEKKYRLLADNISDNIWVIDLATMKFSYSSPSASPMLGYAESESLELAARDVVTEKSMALVARVLGEELAHEGQPGVDPDRTRTLELEQIHKDGHIVWTEANMKFLRNDSGGVTGILGVSRDITGRRHEEDLIRMQRDLAQALGAATNLDEALRIGLEIAIKGSGMDCGGLYLINDETGDIFLARHKGLGEEFVQRAYHIPADSPNMRVLKGERALYGLYVDIGLLQTNTTRAEGLRGSAVIPMRYDGKPIACLNIASHGIDDITPATRDFLETIASGICNLIVRMEIQESLKRSEEKFRLMIEKSPFPIAMVDDATDAISYVNRSLEETLGYTLAMIPTMDAWWKAGFPDLRYRKTIKGKLARGVRHARAGSRDGQTLDVDVRCADGTFKHIEIHMVYMRDLCYFIMSDLTQKKINEEMLIQTEKMLSLGGLAAGMAHEINNPLGIILQGVQGALNRFSPEVKRNREAAVKAGTNLDVILAYLEEREIIEYLNGVREAGMRAAKIVENMLQFSRRGETVIAPVDINALIDKTIEIASYDYDLKKKYDFKKITIRRSYGGGIPLIPCSETGMEQVMLNLLKNSAQALSTVRKKNFMPEIKIKTRSKGRQALIEISDNGPGMPAEIKQHIFEPFYTTRGANMGTGLGLSVSNHIVVENHNGSLSVESKPGKGAAFTIRLPLKRGEPA